jgi:hypothetical protein
MIVGGFLVGGFLTMRYEARLGQMARELARVRQERPGLAGAPERREAGGDDLVGLLRDPATRVIALRGAGGGPAAGGRVVWHERSGGHLLVGALPPATPGRVYAVWMIVGTTPRPAGVLEVDASGHGVHRLPPAAAPVSAFSVTLEPAPAGAAPSGPTVLVSTR